ncbi:MAG: hypothetical protein O2887_10340 [Bacteroidetes bacterium]|nr:hypothetical protein [Bacteroidota bacterium]
MIYQIYFDAESKKNLTEGFTPYYNENLNEFFENQVIVDLYKGQDIFGVLSHDIDVPFKENGLKFTPENLNKVIESYPDVEVFSFQKRRQQNNIVTQAERYHKGIVKMFEKVLEYCEFGALPADLPQIVLFNYLIARPRFWDRYINELLKPAMECLKEMPEAYADSGYARLTRAMSDEKKKRFKDAFDCEWYPYHPFICERLPSIFLRKHKFNFTHIF